MRATSIYFACRHRQKALKMTQIHNLRRCYIQHRCSITVPYYPCHAMMLFTTAIIRLNSFIALFSKCFRINLFPDFSLLKGTNTSSSLQAPALSCPNIIWQGPSWTTRGLAGKFSLYHDLLPCVVDRHRLKLKLKCRWQSMEPSYSTVTKLLRNLCRPTGAT